MDSTRQVRTLSALASAAIVGGVAALLVIGLRPGWVPARVRALVDVTVTPEPSPSPRPSPPPPRQQPKTNGAKGEAGAPNLKSQVTPVVALPAPVILPPPPVIAAPVAGTGDAATQGNAPVAGPGIGAGGNGNGAGGRPAVGPKQIKGKMSAKDLPDDILPLNSSARVGVRYIVEVDGRSTNCRITEPSGYPVIDQLACRLIAQRFIYKPARDERGQPVRSTIVEWHTWFSHDQD